MPDSHDHPEPLEIARIPNNCKGSNAFVVSCGGRAVVIDPADSPGGELDQGIEIRRLGLDLIILTHEHIDHMLGVARLRERFGARLVCSRVCSELIGDPTKNFSRYLVGRDLVCGPADLIAEDVGSELEWCGHRIELIPTPGHSPGSICIALDGALITGDTLLQDLKTVTKLPGGNKRQLAASVDLIFKRFGADTMIYPGHGEPFRLGHVDRAKILGEGSPRRSVGQP